MSAETRGAEKPGKYVADAGRGAAETDGPTETDAAAVERHAHDGGDGAGDGVGDGSGRGTGTEDGPDELVVRDPISAPDAEGRPRRATRRFPLFTRDTARPEGGGRAAPGDAPAPARQWPMLAVLAVVGLGLLLTALDAFRLGTLLVGAALLTGAVLRWLLPGVGMLAVRSRFTDIVTYGLLGGTIVLLALMAQPKPWLEIPFLGDVLHFTIRQ
ncbi:hypothetical protein GCM10010389_30530 [Streptomyces echinoruber]|uniref:DUF3017 domain-containing protein n=1 Tax=Streptomyces echinoruber TaxID=68898 RepID=A0A918R8Z8_9ACTN|nr:hypothetical protein GCM10010389_30530 [Streptomyces echinoruber]